MAFNNEEQLAKTLVHERFHVDQLRGGMPYPVVPPRSTYDGDEKLGAGGHRPRQRLVERAMNNSADLYDAWVDGYERAYVQPDHLADQVCPSCGERQLRLRFAVHAVDDGDGRAAFWCDHCLHGVAFAPVPVPSMGRRVFVDAGEIPNFALVTESG